MSFTACSTADIPPYPALSNQDTTMIPTHLLTRFGTFTIRVALLTCTCLASREIFDVSPIRLVADDRC